VRRLLAPLAATVAGLGVARLVARRRRRPAAEPDARAHDPRAEELRRKLAEARSAVGDETDWSSGELTVDQVSEAAPADPVERRRSVHAEGRSAVERMRATGD
jgi:hypothetical protein